MHRPLVTRLKAAIYARVSTSGQRVDNQLRELHEWASRINLDVAQVFLETVSGAEPDRRQLARLFAGAHQGNFQVVIIWSLDRFSRSGVRATLDLLERLRAYNVVLRSYREPFLQEAQSAFGELLFSIMAFAARQERGALIDRTIAGQARAQAQGKWIGRPDRTEISNEQLETVATAIESGASWRKALAQARVNHGSLSTVRRFLLEGPVPKWGEDRSLGRDASPETVPK